MAPRSASKILALVLAVTALLLPAIAHASSSGNLRGVSKLQYRQLLQAPADRECKPRPHAESCPHPAQYVTDEMRKCFVLEIRQEIRAIDKERRGGEHSVVADFLREVFHDCGPGHCDGSLFLSNQELQHRTNANIDGPENIARIRKRVQENCQPHQISWADTVVLSTAVGIRLLGGPDMQKDIPLGRADSDQYDNVDKLPHGFFNAEELYKAFVAIFPGESSQTVNLLLTTLSGGHTLGGATCGTVSRRKNDGLPEIDPEFKNELQKACRDDCDDKGFDETENRFDNKYFKTLLVKKGLLYSDQTLVSSGHCTSGVCTASIVKTYAENQDLFFKNFKWAFCTLSTLGTDLKCPYDWEALY